MMMHKNHKPMMKEKEIKEMEKNHSTKKMGNGVMKKTEKMLKKLKK